MKYEDYRQEKEAKQLAENMARRIETAATQLQLRQEALKDRNR